MGNGTLTALVNSARVGTSAKQIKHDQPNSVFNKKFRADFKNCIFKSPFKIHVSQHQRETNWFSGLETAFNLI